MRKLKLTAILCFAFLISQAQSKNFIDQPYLEVTGSADTLVTPNEIFIRILISEKDTKDKTSLEELEAKMFAALKSLGIDLEKNLTTNDMMSNYKSYLFKSKDIIKTKQYVLKVGDAVTASNVFIHLEEIGISNTSIDRVSHSNIEGIRNAIRTKAVENARARAHAMIKPLNQTLGSAIHITDSEAYNTGQQIQGRLAGVAIRGYSSAKLGGELPKIEFEKISVTANINVKFVLKP